MMGRVEREAGNYDVVLALCSRRIDVVSPLGHVAGDASYLEMEADALMRLGRREEAAALYAAAAAQYEGEAPGTTPTGAEANLPRRCKSRFEGDP